MSSRINYEGEFIVLGWEDGVVGKAWHAESGVSPNTTPVIIYSTYLVFKNKIKLF